MDSRIGVDLVWPNLTSSAIELPRFSNLRAYSQIKGEAKYLKNIVFALSYLAQRDIRLARLKFVDAAGLPSLKQGAEKWP
jgi:hypothetical protein